MDEFIDDLYNWNTDYEHTNKISILKEALTTINIDYDMICDLNEVVEYYDEYIPPLDINLKDLFKQSNPIRSRVICFSNFDGLPSHWNYNYGEYTYDNIIKQIIDLLYLNPAKVKKEMLSHNWNPEGKWPNYHWRNGKEYVTYDSLIQELENNSGFSLLNFFGVLDIADLNGEVKQIVMPKGTHIGLLDQMCGGGSVWDMRLLRDMTIDLTKPYAEKCKYNTFELVYDGLSGYGYGADNIAGMTGEFWNFEFILKK